MVVTKCPTINGCVNSVYIKILIDAGAEISVISELFINGNKKSFRKVEILPVKQMKIQTVMNYKQVVNRQMFVHITLDNCANVYAPMIVVKKLVTDVIMSMGTQNKYQARVLLVLVNSVYN